MKKRGKLTGEAKRRKKKTLSHSTTQLWRGVRRDFESYKPVLDSPPAKKVEDALNSNYLTSTTRFTCVITVWPRHHSSPHSWRAGQLSPCVSSSLSLSPFFSFLVSGDWKATAM
jgi:hypothetical protein